MGNMRNRKRRVVVLSVLSGASVVSGFFHHSLLRRHQRPHILAPLTLSTASEEKSFGRSAQGSQKSLDGVLVQKVQSGLDLLYPPSELTQRNALSRTDGYWPYIKDGVEPPLEYTYGEYDLEFFGTILDKAIDFREGIGSWNDKTFCDVGSGTGRLVLGAAALYPSFRLCRGVEFLQGCHNMAMETIMKCRHRGDGRKVLEIGNNDRMLPLAPIELTLGSIGDPDTFVGDVDVFFVSSSAMPQEVLTMVSEKVASQCSPGTLVVTMDYEIPTQGEIRGGNSYEFEKLHEMDGYCWVVGGTSTAHFFRLK